MFDTYLFDERLFDGEPILAGGENISLNGYIFSSYRYPIFTWTHNISKPVEDDIKGDLVEKFVLTGVIKANNLTELLALKTTFENQYDPDSISGHCILNLGYGDIDVFVESLDWEPWVGEIKRSLKFAIACTIPSPTYDINFPQAYRGSKTVTVLADTALVSRVKIPLGRYVNIPMGYSGIVTTVAGSYTGDTLQDAVDAAEAENVSSYGDLVEPPQLDRNTIEMAATFKYVYYRSS